MAKLDEQGEIEEHVPCVVQEFCTGEDRKKRRYSRIQVTAFIMSCLSLLVYETDGMSAMSEVRHEIAFEVFLLLWRGINEFFHDEFDLSAVWHHGGFLLVYMIFQYNKRWQKQYSDLAVHMQILHFPMVLWYLGGEVVKGCSPAVPFSELIPTSVSFRFSSMAMATVNSLRLLDGLILAALTCVYFLLDLYWYYPCYPSEQTQKVSAEKLELSSSDGDLNLCSDFPGVGTCPLALHIRTAGSKEWTGGGVREEQCKMREQATGSVEEGTWHFGVSQSGGVAGLSLKVFYDEVTSRRELYATFPPSQLPLRSGLFSPPLPPSYVMCSQALCPQPLSHLQDNFEQLSVSSSTDDDPSESLIDQLSSPLASPRSKMSVDDTSAQDCGAPRRDQQREGGRGPADMIGPCRARAELRALYEGLVCQSDHVTCYEIAEKILRMLLTSSWLLPV
ncbi:hypothetical protein GUITHDRAFT_145690 [Guillardia theta CCMP2712]|uniref:Uncharacterized protein n=1 Tax=Guillardia theta (strain CCMP2712) TaxID=905079 RepID=L1IK78_GUITC|nr:hypothetical protein GUITHDRAFT_145690 [Guillardia theta CCMP2712]EKX36522.1 hypothetical protein GUITHDRAFT_145690 [Guillardia theta CCMP2712]|eukprot:XP_005823502.1 hypothetical protein GUITHDRAFT_145690 [Guillardia theta CCMP2712]